MSKLTIRITREEVRHLTKTRPFIHMRKCLAQIDEGELISLKDIPSPGMYQKFTAVKLILERRFIHHRLFIPSPLEEAIMWYMNHNPDASTTIDADRFAYRVAGVQSVASWKLRRTRKLRAGSQVCFMKGTTAVQKAIYIGAKLCILIWEDGRPLEVTGVHDIKQALGATHISTWHPEG